jgi:hypothetical protein
MEKQKLQATICGNPSKSNVRNWHYYKNVHASTSVQGECTKKEASPSEPAHATKNCRGQQ